MDHRDQSFLSLGPHGFHRIAYTDWGDPGEQHSVVCVHGMTRNGRDFDVLAADLASRCRVVCMDVVGRGKSDWLEDPFDYGFPVYLNDAATLIAVVSQAKQTGPAMRLVERLSGKTPAAPPPPFIDWVGTSLGGLIGMMLASKPSSPIRRLVLNDVGPFIPWQALADLKSMRTSKDLRFASLEEVEAYLRIACVDFGPLSDEQWKSVTRHSVAELDGGGYAMAWDPGIVTALAAGAGHEGVEYGSGFLYGVDLWPVWNAVQCPTLVLWAGESKVLSAATVERMRATGPQAHVVGVPGVGHAPWLMSADQIGVVRDFLLAPDAAPPA